MGLKLGYKQTEVGVIPEDWEIKSLAQVAPLQRGFDLPTSQLKEGPYPVVYSNGVMNFHNRAMARGPGVITGRSGTLGNVHYVETDYWPHNTSLWVTRFNGNAPRFIFYLYSAIGFERFASGSGVPTLNRNDAHAFCVALPSTKAEQKVIADALSDADALIESLEQLLAKKRHLKQGAMQELLTGKKRLPGFSGNWKDCTLRECLRSNPDYGINAAAVSQTGDLPVYLRITDIDDDGRFIPSSRVAVDHPFTMNYRLGENEIVFARTGASVGKTYLYDVADGEVVFAGFLIRAKIDRSKLYPYFLAAFTKTQRYRNWVRMMSMRSGQPGINGNEYAGLPLRLPPTVEEQTAIATILSDMDAEIAALEAKLAKAQQLKQGMMQELLTGKIRLV